MKHINKYSEFRKSLNEAKLSTVHRAAKKGSYPAVIVVVQDGKVIHQEPVSTPDVAPATFNVMQKEYPKALLHLEDKTGKRLFSESVVNEKETLASAIEKEMDNNRFNVDVEFFTRDLRQIQNTKNHKDLHPSIKKVLKALKKKYRIRESVNEAIDLEKIFGTDQETMDMFQGIEDNGTVKDMIEFIDEFGNEEMLSRYGIKSAAQVKKLAKTIMNEATDVNDPVLVAFRATRRDLPKLKLPKVKSRRLSFDKYMDLLDDQRFIDQEIKDMAEQMAQTLRDMEQEAEPEGGKIADKYGSIMMKQEKEYAKLKAKKAKIDARLEKHRMD